MGTHQKFEIPLVISTIMTKDGYSEIYLIISPSGKRYIGQTQCLSRKGKSYGTIERWKAHLRDARAPDGGRCRLLNDEIQQFTASEFEVIPLITCKSDVVNKFEKEMILQYHSLNDNGNNPYGLNIRQGGKSGDRLPDDTRARQSEGQHRYYRENGKRSVTAKTKVQISQSLIDRVVRYDHKGEPLPKYMKYVEWKDRCGYEILGHPTCKRKYFVSSTKSLDELKEMCVSFLDSLNETANQ